MGRRKVAEAAVDARDFPSTVRRTIFLSPPSSSLNFGPKMTRCPQDTHGRDGPHTSDGRFPPHGGREEKKRRQSNCLPRVTVTFCLVPGKGAVLTLPGYAGEGDGVTGCSHVCSKLHNTLTEIKDDRDRNGFVTWYIT